MKLNLTNISVDQALRRLELLLNGRLKLDNCTVKKVQGTTNAVADTQTWFEHRLGQTPVCWFAVEGDVYVEKLGQERVDIRSRLTSEEFTIYLFA